MKDMSLCRCFIDHDGIMWRDFWLKLKRLAKKEEKKATYLSFPIPQSCVCQSYQRHAKRMYAMSLQVRIKVKTCS